MKKIIILTTFSFLFFSLAAQLRLDVVGDAKIVGKLSLIKSVGDSSVFIGANAGKSADLFLIGGTFIGTNAGENNSFGQANTFIGYNSGKANTQGEINTFVGSNSGQTNTLGACNTFVGVNSGIDITTGNRNTFIGFETGLSIVTDSVDRAIAIGHKAKVNCHNCAVIGGTGDDQVKVAIGTTLPITDLHIVQKSSATGQRGIRLEYHANVNHWDTYIDADDDYNFAYNDDLKAYITDFDGSYVKHSPPLFHSENDGHGSRNKNVKKMDTVLDKVMKLQPVIYKNSESRQSQKKSWSFIAEEVARVFPEITPEKNGQKGIIYDYFGILSIKAIQELASTVKKEKIANEELIKENEVQDNKIESLENKVAELSALVEKMLSQHSETPKGNSYLLPLEQKALLAQNQPNPFTQNTIVDYFVPAEVQKAYIQITGFDGKILGNVHIKEAGKGHVTIQSKNYPTGTYFYSLVLDGVVKETKRMVLAR